MPYIQYLAFGVSAILSGAALMMFGFMWGIGVVVVGYLAIVGVSMAGVAEIHVGLHDPLRMPLKKPAHDTTIVVNEQRDPKTSNPPCAVTP